MALSNMVSEPFHSSAVNLILLVGQITAPNSTPPQKSKHSPHKNRACQRHRWETIMKVLTIPMFILKQKLYAVKNKTIAREAKPGSFEAATKVWL